MKFVVVTIQIKAVEQSFSFAPIVFSIFFKCKFKKLSNLYSQALKSADVFVVPC